MNMEKVTTSMDVSLASWTGVATVIIMEDCGGNEPDGDKWNLYSFANPSVVLVMLLHLAVAVAVVPLLTSTARQPLLCLQAPVL